MRVVENPLLFLFKIINDILKKIEYRGFVNSNLLKKQASSDKVNSVNGWEKNNDRLKSGKIGEN